MKRPLNNLSQFPVQKINRGQIDWDENLISYRKNPLWTARQIFAQTLIVQEQPNQRYRLIGGYTYFNHSKESVYDCYVLPINHPEDELRTIHLATALNWDHCTIQDVSAGVHRYIPVVNDVSEVADLLSTKGYSPRTWGFVLWQLDRAAEELKQRIIDTKVTSITVLYSVLGQTDRRTQISLLLEYNRANRGKRVTQIDSGPRKRELADWNSVYKVMLEKGIDDSGRLILLFATGQINLAMLLDQLRKYNHD